VGCAYSKDFELIAVDAKKTRNIEVASNQRSFAKPTHILDVLLEKHVSL